jgi:diguanylate cyclase (GGDEF)-like protein
MHDRSDGTITTVGVDGVRRMFAFLRLDGTDAHVAIGLDESEVLSRINRETSIAYTQLAIICAAVLLGVWAGGEHLIIRPIRSLARSATRIGMGNLETRLTTRSWAAEFAPLAAALDTMTRKLSVREDELRFANTHLAELASIDGLSGLANRRTFDVMLAAEWQRATEQHRVLGLLMIDVDHFKPFNDNHGHVEGDECLRAVGAVIAGVAAGGSCLAARYGGEEFALLLPGTDIDESHATAERLRRAVADLHIVNAGAPSGLLTISVGVASLDPQPDQNPQMLVETADIALYAAKRSGRNAVVAHSASVALPA